MSNVESHCTRLGIPVPSPEAAVRGGAKLFHLVIMALLERGGPMTLDELVARLARAGLESWGDDLATAILKAWHGLAPVVRDRTGRFDLDTDDEALKFALFRMGLWTPAPRQEPRQVTLPPDRPDDVPLVEEEIEAAFGNASSWSLSTLRRVAAVLDVAGTALTQEQVAARLREVSGGAFTDRDECARARWPGDLVTVDAQGRLVLNRESTQLFALRRDVRKRARTVLLQKANAAQTALQIEAMEAERAERRRAEAAAAAAARRAVLRVFPGPDVQAAALIDLEDRSIRTFLDDVAELPDALGRYNVLIGLDLRETLAALGLEPRNWKLIDLGPPRKTRKLNRGGHTLRITTELLIAGSVGISRALGNPKQTAAWLASRDLSKLERRLAADAKHLHAYYRYGVLHGFVRLRWGFLDETLDTSWAMAGDTHLHDVLEQAQRDDCAVELVLGWSAPGWADPWSRARRYKVVQYGWGDVRLSDGQQQLTVLDAEIQAARLCTTKGETSDGAAGRSGSMESAP